MSLLASGVPRDRARRGPGGWRGPVRVPALSAAGIHPHALAATLAAEAAAIQGRFWEMHDMLFHRQTALEQDDLRRYAAELGLDAARFDTDRAGEAVLERVQRDVRSGTASGEVVGTPTLFIDGVVHRGGYDAGGLLDALTR